MSATSHQTIKLSKGKHLSPRDGACVMELASMLAGEPFTDHPISVCPVIGSLLRSYNDSIDDDRRQDLYAYAAAVVGTRASQEVQDLRAARVMAWAAENRERRLPRALLPPRLRRLRLCPPRSNESSGEHAVRSIRGHNDRTHAQMLALIDELIALGRPPEPDSDAFGALGAAPCRPRAAALSRSAA
jgi:hypothetical protein